VFVVLFLHVKLIIPPFPFSLYSFSDSVIYLVAGGVSIGVIQNKQERELVCRSSNLLFFSLTN
jgi:hypothetical protein